MGGLSNMLQKKVKASSITETIAATSIIIIVFTIAIFSINNILKNSIENDTSAIEREIEKLTYQSRYKKIETPNVLDLEKWVIQISKTKKEGVRLLSFEAINKSSKKKVTKTIVSYEN
jgi:oligoribonuclease (3'-5' exoribonuclease)